MLVIFDCDGVLADTEIIAARVDAELLHEAGLEISAEEVAHRYAGLTTERIFELAGEELGRALPDSLLARAEEETDRRLEQEALPIAGAEEMLDRLEWPRCVCSNSRPERLRVTLEVIGLYDRFRPYVFSAREVGEGRGKPAPDVFLHAAAVMETAPADTIVIEDSVAGVAGAVAAGMRVVGFVGASHTWPGHGEALMDAGAITVIRRLADVPATVEALREWSSDLV
ncbi:HAD family hydrolase [Propylenella binzhouense]|uniref:HAD family hydrolase n=1 Tax=Propylenella binzhouense TaxID=2555902 RepID=A0A964T561_9HYPH|nr:HAD-IA family hydrolase [Propylenella binzhouense]MYZ48564.1 HAD family hydrolase [Propylenella binzhouense]